LIPGYSLCYLSLEREKGITYFELERVIFFCKDIREHLLRVADPLLNSTPSVSGYYSRDSNDTEVIKPLQYIYTLTQIRLVQH